MTALVYCPFPDRAAAEAAANCLLDERLIVCANFAAGIAALFAWQGERGSADEVAALFKTDTALLDAVVARLEAIHPYDTPAIFGWPCTAAGSATRAWTEALAGGKE